MGNNLVSHDRIKRSEGPVIFVAGRRPYCEFVSAP